MKHYHQRLVDLLAALAQKTTEDIYVTLKGQSWNISTTADRHNAKIDRGNLQQSITKHVEAMMPIPESVQT